MNSTCFWVCKLFWRLTSTSICCIWQNCHKSVVTGVLAIPYWHMEKQGGVANRILISLSNRFPILLFVGCFCNNNANRPFLQITVPCRPSCDAAKNCVSSRFSGQRLDSVRVHTATCSLWMYLRVESAWLLLCIPGQTGRAGERILGAPSQREFVLRHD